jgi:hypothetical protein
MIGSALLGDRHPEHDLPTIFAMVAGIAELG